MQGISPAVNQDGCIGSKQGMAAKRLKQFRHVTYTVSIESLRTWLLSSSELCDAAVSMSCEPDASPLHSCVNTLRPDGSSAMVGRPPGNASDILLRRLMVLHGVGLTLSCNESSHNSGDAHMHCAEVNCTSYMGPHSSDTAFLLVSGSAEAVRC